MGGTWRSFPPSEGPRLHVFAISLFLSLVVAGVAPVVLVWVKRRACRPVPLQSRLQTEKSPKRHADYLWVGQQHRQELNPGKQRFTGCVCVSVCLCVCVL